MAEDYLGKLREGRPVREDFLVILIQDVIGAIARRDVEDTQANRRDLIRTVFAAIEGAVWDFRSETVESARSIDQLSSAEEFVFAEANYLVSEKGNITLQPRFIPMLALIRLTARLASKISPEFQPRFDDRGWHDFRNAIKIRNRITHPKKKADLVLTSPDAESCIDALHWFLELHRSAMEAGLQSMRQHSMLVDEVVQGLKDGDPELLELYDAVARRMEE